MGQPSSIVIDAEPPTRKRGRPRSSDGVDPVDILEAAIDAISRGGYDALSMRGVARSLGVSLATVQHHFGSKAELYRAVVDHALDEAATQRSLVPERDLYQRVRLALETSSARPGLLAAFLGDRADGHEERLDHFARRFGALFDDPATTVDDLRGGHSGRPIDADAFMVLLTIGITTMAGAPESIRAVYGIDLASAEERSQLARGLADILGSGIFGSPDADDTADTIDEED